ncbi:hypothetical protein [Chelativorans salis]|uniref:DUF3052 domain-containing protein n=1 Tax=Chelativorans salis TaxID=2978478 RepID=A0ABT2LIZ8_9HYPH|nr:hypothetical protein [Chelativorans sp. EGI FJ00035]MCT7374555.1 hypothetical protein [Chelativorans sp. EGI FJ00035]
MTRSVANKMGIRAGTRSLLVDAPQEAVDAMQLPQIDLKKSRHGTFGYIHMFVTKQADMERRFLELARHLDKGGMLWVSWPKGRAMGADLTLRDVIRIGYENGLVESTTVGIDDTWSAIRFTHPKPGKDYRNSYGKLPHRSGAG